jgi:hypothetical protein
MQSLQTVHTNHTTEPLAPSLCPCVQGKGVMETWQWSRPPEWAAIVQAKGQAPALPDASQRLTKVRRGQPGFWCLLLFPDRALAF